LIRHPDGHETPLPRLPASRGEAIDWVRAENTRPGRYEYIRRPGCAEIDGDIDYAEMAVTVYEGGEAGITRLCANAAGFAAEECDIAAYVRAMSGPSGVVPRLAVLSAQGGHPARDHEAGRVSLILETLNGEATVEFLLEPGGWLDLADIPESSRPLLFCCQLPSVRSVVHFAKVALEAQGIAHAHIRFGAFSKIWETRFA
jgi:hypothetical protein